MKTRDLTLTALFAALIAVCSWISIPTAVPFTLQTFAVFLALGVLGGKRGTAAVAVYLLMGALGLPVFANQKGGIGVLMGSTGGYLIGFLAAALVMWGLTRIGGNGAVKLFLGMMLGLLALYSFGTAWFLFVYVHSGGAATLRIVLSWCVFPFILPDILKAALALWVAKRLRTALKER